MDIFDVLSLVGGLSLFLFGMTLMGDAVEEVVDLAVSAFTENNVNAASMVEPLEQVIDGLKDSLRSGHIGRLQKGLCSIENGFVWADLLNGLERTADHCSNIAACVIDMADNNLNLHDSVRSIRSDGEDFEQNYLAYSHKYALPNTQN